jgi:hypothetical protein
MTAIPAEFYALTSAFLFALHNIFIKNSLRYSNPATGVVSSFIINIVLLCGLSISFLPLSSLTRASILIFVVVDCFNPDSRACSLAKASITRWIRQSFGGDSDEQQQSNCTGELG